jgi:hypothetical protein
MSGSKYDVIQHCRIWHKRAIRYPNYTGNIQFLERRHQGDYNLIHINFIAPLFGKIQKL